MLKRKLGEVIKDPVWLKVLSFSVILLLAFLSDAILSYWVPNFLEGAFSSSSKMGLILSSSSLIGLGADLLLPQIIRGITVRKLVFIGLLSNLAFSSNLFINFNYPIVVLSLSAMAIWGIYYEIFSFAQQEFVSDAVPLRLHAASWGIIGVFKSVSYFLGPILGSLLFERNNTYPLYIAFILGALSLLVLSLQHTKHARTLSVEPSHANLFAEMSHWKVLLRRVWPIVTLSLVYGLIDALFWSVGAVYMEDLSKVNFFGKLFLAAYTVPSLFMGFVVARWAIYKGKKKLSLKISIAAGVILSFISFSKNIYWQLGVVFLSSMLLAASYPLIEGVYSDIVARMGRERRHMMGLCSSSVSLAYIGGPLLGGVIADRVGNQNSFLVMGVFTAIVSFLLLLFTPRKLKVPQSEISKWKD